MSEQCGHGTRNTLVPLPFMRGSAVATVVEEPQISSGKDMVEASTKNMVATEHDCLDGQIVEQLCV